MAFVTPLAFTCTVFPDICREESSTLTAKFAEPEVEPPVKPEPVAVRTSVISPEAPPATTFATSTTPPEART